MCHTFALRSCHTTWAFSFTAAMRCSAASGGSSPSDGRLPCSPGLGLFEPMLPLTRVHSLLARCQGAVQQHTQGLHTQCLHSQAVVNCSERTRWGMRITHEDQGGHTPPRAPSQLLQLAVAVTGS